MGCARISWQKIGGASPSRGKASPAAPAPSDARGSGCEASREAFAGETVGWVLSCETG